MRLDFTKLNGWQRLFIVLTIAIQVPFSILIASELPITSPTSNHLNAQFQQLVLNEKLSQAVSIDDIVTLSSPMNSGKDNLIELYKESERRGLGKLVAFHASSYPSPTYYVYLDNLINEAQQLKVGELIQTLIDKEFSKSKINNYVLTFSYSIFFSITLYLLGISIGWIINGFRKNQI